MKLHLLKTANFNFICFQTTKFRYYPNFNSSPTKLLLKQKNIKYVLTIINYYFLVRKKILFLSDFLAFNSFFNNFTEKLNCHYFPLFLLPFGSFSNPFVSSTLLKKRYFTKKQTFSWFQTTNLPAFSVFLNTKPNTHFTHGVLKLKVPTIFLKFSNTKSIYVFFLFLKSLITDFLRKICGLELEKNVTRVSKKFLN